MSKTLIGLDFETTGINHNKHVPLSLGIAWYEGSKYRTRHMEFSLFTHELHEWEPEAMTVNKMSLHKHTYNLDMSTYSSYVKNNDYALFNILSEVSSWPGDLVPVGWNVYGFDMRFLLEYFPKSAGMFYYSSRAELNTMCTMMDRIKHLESGTTKRQVKNEAHDILSIECPHIAAKSAHDAEYDALLGLVCYEILDNMAVTLKND